jgi:hypothetical protein
MRATAVPNVTRTTLGIRNLLFDEIDALRNGTTTPQKAGAVAKMVTPIVNSVKVEIEYAKHVAGKGNPVLSTLTLGYTTGANASDDGLPIIKKARRSKFSVQPEKGHA